MKEMVGQKELQKRVERTSGPARTPTTESKELKKYGTIFIVLYNRMTKMGRERKRAHPSTTERPRAGEPRKVCSDHPLYIECRIL